MRRSISAVCSIVLVVVLQGWTQFYPQNARMNALGGTFILEDFSDIMRYPVEMTSYRNAMQATWNNAIFGVKSVGDVLSLGVVVNRGMMMDESWSNSFYQNGVAMINSLASLDPLAGTVDPVRAMPHVLIGTDLSVVSIGVDLFWEHTGIHFDNKTAAATTTLDGGVHNFGTIASGRMKVADIPIKAKVGVSLPGISGKYSDGTNEVEVGSESGLFLNFGGETDIPLSDFTVTAGLDLIFENYEFTVDDSSNGNVFGNSKKAFYAGIKGDVFTDAKWGAQYTLAVLDSNGTTTADTLLRRDFIHALSCGLENRWSSVWKFDELIFRGGLLMNITTVNRNRKDGVNDLKSADAVAYGPVIPTIGAGVRKSFFQLDIILNPTTWAGVVSGPQVGQVTATVTF